MKAEHDELPVRELLDRHDAIYVVVAPPRSSSTALARVFWEHPAIGYYCHEPFDACYHRGRPLASAAKALSEPVEVGGAEDEGAETGADLVVKEMTFQVGAHFPALAAMSSAPLVFLLRDPRLTIASRMNRRLEGGQDPIFPFDESGWTALAEQVETCRGSGIDYVLVDSTELRNHPQTLLPALFERIGLSFSVDQIAWDSVTDTDLGALGEEQAHWYSRVLESRALEPATEQIPSVESFPAGSGWRRHIHECLEIYRDLREDQEMLSSPPPGSAAPSGGHTPR